MDQEAVDFMERIDHLIVPEDRRHGERIMAPNVHSREFHTTPRGPGQQPLDIDAHNHS